MLYIYLWGKTPPQKVSLVKNNVRGHSVSKELDQRTSCGLTVYLWKKNLVDWPKTNKKSDNLRSSLKKYYY